MALLPNLRELRKRLHGDKDKPVSIRIRQRLQQHGVNDAEHHSIRADAERERQDSHRSKARILAKHSRSEFQIVEKIEHRHRFLFRPS